MVDREALWSMEVFLAITAEGSLAAAARSLRVTPSAVSKQMTKLERNLRVRLLERTTRTLRVTPAGERYRAHAQQIVAALQAAEDDVRSEEIALTGELRLSAPTLLGQELLAPLMARFLRANPELRIDLTLDDRFVDLVSEPYDLAIRVATRLPESGLAARRVGLLRWIFVASPIYVREKGTPRRPEDLAHHACLDLAHGSDRGRWKIAFAQREVEVRVRGPLVSSSLVAIHRAALEGLGVAQLPTYLVRADLAAERLVQVMPGAGRSRASIFAVTPSRAFHVRRVRAFIDYLASELPRVLL